MAIARQRKNVSKNDKDDSKASSEQKDAEPKSNASLQQGITTQSIVKRSLIRVVFIVGALIVANYYQQQETDIDSDSLAQQNEVVSFKRFHVRCSNQYNKKFASCIPRSCGRSISDTIATPEEATQLLNMAKKGFALGESGGGASILDLHSGALSKGDKFIDIYKLTGKNVPFTSSDLALYEKVKNKIKRAVAKEFNAAKASLYFTHPTFFSKMTNKKAKTIHDEYWHVHNDKETYENFDYTALLYLADYRKDFTGGRFVFVDKDTNRTVEPRFGRVSMFTSGKENPHFVEPVASGVRYALTIGFSCDKKNEITLPTIETS